MLFLAPNTSAKALKAKEKDAKYSQKNLS